MGFNSAFKGLICVVSRLRTVQARNYYSIPDKGKTSFYFAKPPFRF